MKKFDIVESEKNRILGMHKSLLKEQDSNVGDKSIKDQLQVFIDKGCFPNGKPKVVPMKSTNPKKQFAIKIESTKTPGKFRYFFVDNSVGQMENGTFQFLQSKWSCETKKTPELLTTSASTTMSASTETSADTQTKLSDLESIKQSNLFKTSLDVLEQSFYR